MKYFALIAALFLAGCNDDGTETTRTVYHFEDGRYAYFEDGASVWKWYNGGTWIAGKMPTQSQQATATSQDVTDEELILPPLDENVVVPEDGG